MALTTALEAPDEDVNSANRSVRPSLKQVEIIRHWTGRAKSR